MIPLIEFQRAILDKLLKEDALCVIGEGLGHQRILLELVRICATKNTLVFLLNCSSDDEERLREGLLQLKSGNDFPIPTLNILKNDTLSIQSITPEGNVSFILRIYREKNQEGFIKAISDKPHIFNSDFSGVEKNLKFLQLRKLHLWPRFQLEIKANLSNDINVIEYKQPMTIKMVEAQQTILDCMIATVNEIKKQNRYIEFDDFEYSMNTEFESKVKQSLNSVWHRVSPKTKQLVSDLRILRFLMVSLMHYDCVMFNEYLESLLVSSLPGKTSVFKNGQESSWMLTDSGNLLFNIARERVFKLNPKNIEPSYNNALISLNLPPGINLILEPLPKWNLIEDILKQIQSESIDVKPSIKDLENFEKNKKKTILIMVDSKYTLTQLIDYFESSQSVSGVVSPHSDNTYHSNQNEINEIYKTHHRLLIKSIQNYFSFKKKLGSIRNSSQQKSTSSVSNNYSNSFNPSNQSFLL
ncbi:DNA repair protein rad16 [Smittium culicis]|uniref:DNA repair protein rad16 n=1 Tax=Smittium culicis TaxID=133412 RepID=A0A1R1XPW9_9FUNG|nr:DNA repair protein rad16 [Smittium culicis]